LCKSENIRFFCSVWILVSGTSSEHHVLPTFRLLVRPNRVLLLAIFWMSQPCLLQPWLCKNEKMHNSVF